MGENMDGWTCEISQHDTLHTITVDYYMGKGHNGAKPTAVEVVNSLVLDSSVRHETFSEWCADFGADTDSRKALATYLTCQDGYAKLRKLLGSKLDEYMNTEGL